MRFWISFVYGFFENPRLLYRLGDNENRDSVVIGVRFEAVIAAPRGGLGLGQRLWLICLCVCVCLES